MSISFDDWLKMWSMEYSWVLQKDWSTNTCCNVDEVWNYVVLKKQGHKDQKGTIQLIVNDWNYQKAALWFLAPGGRLLMSSWLGVLVIQMLVAVITQP